MTRQETNQTTETQTPKRDARGSFDQLAHEIVEIGRAWAGYGLTVASRSLQTSAQTIDLAAGSLDRLSRAFVPGEPEATSQDEDAAVIIDEPKNDDDSTDEA
jgi:hypothetical protein